MSDDTTSNPQHSDDPTGPELRAVAVSAYVDGEASPDEVRMVESDAALLADVRRLRALKDAVGAAPPLPPGHRDHLLAGALAEFDARRGTASHGQGGQSGPSVAAPPPPPRAGGGRWLAVAAAVIVVVAAGGLAVSLATTSDSDESSSVADEPLDSPTEAERTSLTATTEAAGDVSGSAESAATDESESPGAVAVNDTATAESSAASRASADGEPDSLEELADDRAMVDWVLQVQDGAFIPDGQGDVICGREVLGAATHRGDEVVVAIEEDRLVARDTDTCGEVLSADAP
ncbi:MAG: hypothetical protein ACR2LO_12690 [Ilumatobacteraceae bacterium]